ncbi:hypothetical protein [Auraticoccus monumenti]|uniref:Uncharacterized protein n=1 Tax=Auraticoccus monumenti TaxID=675864 RepID=A0A1G7DRB8_9ACTN|nr:hypothetical protein [Auraticoccus monumenti]SDE54037.1 hypothetical protein SAMN04489747_3685 [Auraticoccus monumenti]
MNTSQVLVWIVIGLVVVAIAVAIVLAVRRHKWIQSLTDRGWRFVDSPRLDSVITLVRPPFGQGFTREVDDQVVGEAGPARTPFQVLEYHAGSFSDRVAVLRLTRPLPGLYVAGQTSPRRDVIAAAPHPHPRWSVLTEDHAFADAALSVMAGPLEELARVLPVDLSVDGHDLVALGAPKEAEELAAVLEALAAVAASLGTPALEGFRTPEPEARFRFHGHPDWVYHGDRDDMLRLVRHTTNGFGHRAEHVLTGGRDGLAFIALRHHWKTQRTVTSTDSEGRTTTRTVTDHHSEDLCEVALPAVCPLLSVGGGGWFRPGEKIHFESEAFNDSLEVRSTAPRFAHDVIHPRQIEYLMARRPPAFTIEGQVLRISSDHDTVWLGRALESVTGFLARVPGWVWKDLGLPVEPAFTRPELG